jgi:PEP-CTERM motif
MRISRRVLAALPLLFLVLARAQNMYADSVTFDFSFSGTGITASGSLTATLVAGNEFLVTSISGMQNGSAMTLLAPGAYADNNNDVFTTGPFLNVGGLAFVLSNGTTDYNVYYDAGTGTYLECNSMGGACSVGAGTTIKGQVTEVGTVPEPGTLVLLGSGLIGLAGVARRKLLG